jgi:hypothetical protein
VYRWFANKVNAQGGLYLSDYDAKVPIELVVHNFDVASWDIGVVTEGLIDDGVDFIWGGPGTDCIFTQAPVCNAYGVVYIGLEGGASSMISDELIDSWPYAWSTLSFSNWYQIPVLHDIMQEATGKDNPVAYMTYIGGAGATHGIEYSTACKEAFGEENVIDAGFHDYVLAAAPGAADAIIAAAADALGDPADPNYDIFCAWTYPWNVAELTIALMNSTFNPPAIIFGSGANTASYYADFGPYAEGIMDFVVATEESSPELAQMYSNLAGQIELDWADPNLPCDQGSYTSGSQQLDYWGHPCYVAGLEMWVQAVENAGNLDSTAVRNELAKFSSTNPCDTVLGDCWFTVFGGGNGGGILAYECHPGEIGQWQDGVYKIIGYNGVTSVIPAYDVTGDFVYPMTDQWAWLGR